MKVPPLESERSSKLVHQSTKKNYQDAVPPVQSWIDPEFLYDYDGSTLIMNGYKIVCENLATSRVPSKVAEFGRLKK